MIHIVENYRSHPRQDLIGAMFEDRKRLFVDLYGWDLTVVDGHHEIDQFDTAATLYIIQSGETGGHEASIRLMPTTQAHMLRDIFPHLCPGGVPTGPRIWESTRLCLPKRHGAGGRKRLRNILISRMVDLALVRGISCLTGVLPDAFRKEVLAMGWAAEPLGPAVPDSSGLIGAFAAHVTPDTPARLGWSGVYAPHDEEVVA